MRSVALSAVLVAASFLVTLAAIGTVTSWPFDGGGEAAAVTLAPDDPAVVAQGAAVYASACASCHGANLEGQPDWIERGADGKLPAPPHDATGHTWHHWDAQLVGLVRSGLPKEVAGKPYLTDMPAYGDVLTDGEIVAVLSFIKSRWPADVRAQHDTLNSRIAAAASGG